MAPPAHRPQDRPAGSSPAAGDYGAAFAEVYDDWYPGGDEAQICGFLTRRLPAGARVLELGVGTGRVALALADAGFAPLGVDSSPEMIARLRDKDPTGRVEVRQGDVGDPAWWAGGDAPGGIDAVVAPCNLLFNLVGRGAQEACVAGAARALRPGGLLVNEMQRLDGAAPAGGTSTSVARAGGVEVRTRAGDDEGTIEGVHVERGPDGDRRERRWTIRPIRPTELAAMCSDAALVPRGVFAGWTERAAGPGDPVVVTVHRRPGSTPGHHT